MSRAWAVAAIAAAACAGCQDRPGGAAPPRGVPAVERTDAAAGEPCGELACRAFPTARAAFEEVLAARPAVLAIGEAHAPAARAAHPTTARRFREELLPALDGRASDLVLELLAPPGGCEDAAAAARGRHAEVHAEQAPTNQGDYVALGEAARARGVVPDLLRPTCADLAALAAPGGDAVGASLALIARLTEAKASRLVARAAADPGARGKMVVTYGGLLHNDAVPAPERAAWSFGPALARATGGRFVELDVVDPAFVDAGAEHWARLAWVARYDAARWAGRAVLYRTGPASHVLVLPAAPP